MLLRGEEAEPWAQHSTLMKNQVQVRVPDPPSGSEGRAPKAEHLTAVIYKQVLVLQQPTSTLLWPARTASS